MDENDAGSGENDAGRKRRKPKQAPRGKPFAKGNKRGHRFKKGDPGGPGRPPLPPGYNEAFELMEPEAWQAIREIVTEPAHKDRLQASTYIVNRRRGKPTERTEVTGAGGKPLEREFPEILEAFKKLAGEE